MIKIKRLFASLKKYLYSFKNIFLLFLVSAFLITRSWMLIPFLAILISLSILETLWFKIYPFVRKVLLVVATVASMVASYSHQRFSSWDGLLWYVKRVINLTETAKLPTLYAPHPPYPVEIFLGQVLKFTNFNFISLLLYLVFLIDVFVIYKFIKENEKSKDLSFLSTFVIVTSPMFMEFAFFQFKIEVFQILFFTLSLLFWLKNDLRKWQNSLVFGFLTGITILIKVSIFPFYAAMYGTILTVAKI